MRSRKFRVVVAWALLMLSGLARADEASDLKAKFEALQQQFESLKSQLDAVTTE